MWHKLPIARALMLPGVLLGAACDFSEQVRAELADIVSGRKPGRLSPEEIVIFDSTGTAVQDVAAAAVVYQRARSTGAGFTVSLGGGRHA